MKSHPKSKALKQNPEAELAFRFSFFTNVRDLYSACISAHAESSGPPSGRESCILELPSQEEVVEV